jgi:hypothetical protein
MSLRVYGIMTQDGHGRPKLPEHVRLIAMRELCAVAEEGDFTANDLQPQDTRRHLEIVSALYRDEAILPLPVGTVFRNEDVLNRWMDLHYVALSDALAWVEDRVAARVHINRASGKESERDAGSDLAAVAAEVTKGLRRHAVSVVPLRNEQVTGIAISAAYLVERQLWEEFREAVTDELERHPQLSIEVTGPWPAYDFVRLQFGS